MNLFFYTEARLIKAKDGNIYNPEGVQNKDIFQRYLDVFTEITVVARVKEDLKYNPREVEIVNSDKIHVYEIAYYIGLKQYLFKRRSIHLRIKELIKRNESAAHILRLPGNIGSIAFTYLKNRKYGVEVAGDPYDVFETKFFKNPLKYFIRNYAYFNLKKITRKAESSIYVTVKTLQSRYPCKLMFNASNVKISKEEILEQPKKIAGDTKDISILSIGTLEQMYKSPDVLIRAIECLKADGYNPKLIWIGEGKFKSQMIKLAESLNLTENVTFKGYINNRNEIIRYLDRSNFFVLASSTEGLPRVIIEAFSRGLPVIGTSVGGIPELLNNDMLVDVGNSEMISEKIKFLIENKDLYLECSLNNLVKAKNFEEKKLQENRIKFYKTLL